MTYEILNEMMREDADENRDRSLAWRDLPQLTRRHHMLAYLEEAGMAQTLCEALSTVRPRASAELHKAFQETSGSAVVDILWLFLERELGPNMANRWNAIQDDATAMFGECQAHGNDPCDVCYPPG